MDNNYRWRPQDQHYHYQEPPQHPQQNIRYGSAAADSVQNAQGLLAVYPMASAMPTNHAVRHVSNMYTTAAPPTHAQPSYYTPRNSYAQGSQLPYSEYDHQVRYLSASHQPVNDGGYWTTARDNAVRILADQQPSSYRYPAQQNWYPPQGPNSSFQTSPFAHSVLQRTAPATNAYPTPSPPIMQMSSSSLANALGPPPPHSSTFQPKPQPPPPPQKVYRPEESRAFFNNFLEQKAQEMNSTTQVLPPHRARPIKTPSSRVSIAALVKPPPDESPDPISVMANSSPVPVTPRKRKPVVEIESPSIKRMQMMRNEYVGFPKLEVKPSVAPTPITPSSKSTTSVESKAPTPTSKRPVNLAYVAVPRSPWLTPTSRKNGFVTPTISPRKQEKSRVQDTPDDLGGYGEDDYDSPVKRRDLTDSVKSSARRTGDRDDRAPLEKFLCLVEDIFEAEDGLPSEVGVTDLPDYFSTLSIDSAQPQLHSNHIRKLTKYIGQITRPNQRLRNTNAGVMNTPRAHGRMAEVETQVLSRLLKILDRTVKAGEDLDPFRYVAPPPGSAKSSPRKKSTKSKKADARPSQTPRPGSDDLPSQDTDRRSVEEEDREFEADLTEVDYEKLSQTLDAARESILAADCCIALLGSDRLTKQLYSEELIISCFSAVKNQLTKIIYPFVEMSSGTAFEVGSRNPLLRFVVKDNSSEASGHRKQLSGLFQALASVFPRINNLVNAETVAMSDAIIISAVYIAIGPFFVVESGEGDAKSKKEKDNVVLRTFGKSAMRGLRLDALALIRSIFANHESQRSWIIEEILTSLIKLSDTKQKAGQFRLRDGRSIRIVSVLLLQLVQTSAHDVRIKARKIERSRQNQLALRRQESFPESQQAQEAFLDENDHEEIVLYKGGLDAAIQAAKTIISFLTKRSGKGKTTKNSNEAEYRAIFDNLIGDLLVVLFWPEWPAAGVLLSMICKYMVNALDDKHTHSQVDSNAAKTIALDHLGVIAAKIRTAMLKFQAKGDQETKGRPLKSMEEIVNNQDVKALDRLLKAHRDVANHLAKRSSEDQAYDSARELSAALLGQELASALQQLQRWIETPELDDDLDIKDSEKLKMFARKIRGALRDVWKDPPTDVFNTGTQDEADRIDLLGEELGTLQTMRSSFNPILNTIVGSLNASVIFMRTKALRALGQIVTSDPTVLAMPVVRRGIENHLLDSSPAVRDAAVELIGKYMIDSPEVAGDYYQKIADRMADTGLSVRKRVIKLLKSFYSVTQDTSRKTDIAFRMVLRMMDEDDTVKELATKTIEELWFPNASITTATTRGRSAANSQQANDKNATLAKVAVIMGTAAQFKDRSSPLEDLLHKIIAEKPETEVQALHSRYSEICETLIDGLVDATDMPGFTVVNCIRTIYLFTSAYPPVLSGANASTLLPYLKSASSTNEELATTDYLLKIFRVSIPHMPQTAAKFGQELQLALQPMIIKPSGNGGVQILQEAVSCMCVVVQHLTQDFIRLVNLLKSCNGRLQQAIKRPVSNQMSQNDVRALLVLVFIVALLGEHCNFDRLRTEDEALAKELNSISKESIVEHIYGSLLQLYEKYPEQPMIRGRTLQCLGFLFRAQPTLMTEQRSASIMDAIFDSPEEEGKGRLLRIMQEFLVSESEKHSVQLKETVKSKTYKPANVNMDELIGNTDGFADSGVSSAIVQRYLSQVLEAALSPHSPNQSAAVDILSFTIKQGLAHPLQSFPVIIALETSTVNNLSGRAAALHAILQGKHASLLNTRYIVSARTSFDYQKKATKGAIQGYRADPVPVALLQKWYSLVREKRPARQEFLKSLVKVFQENPDYKSTQDDVDFTRYMAENFAAFDYKTQEEVITVIKFLTMVLSTTGMQLLEIVSPSHLLKQLHEPLNPTSEGPSQPNPETQNAMDVDVPPAPAPVPRDTPPAPATDEVSLDKLPLMRTSVIIAIVMLLKAHLKSLYSLSEEKCHKFVIGKKTAAGDKPATRRNDMPISWDRLPYATTPMLTTEDIKIQKARFLDIWNEDGVTGEPEDELDFT
ncbi:Protein rad9 [Leucoagaricus sp. SymC.cos]|nr:Protein rad9 [Leucoagaricus sp. SymC.cos]